MNLGQSLDQLMELREAVRTYFSWVYEARVDGTDCEKEIQYWESEMERLSNG